MGGWLYLATVIDIASRRIVGYAIADHLRTELVADALADAIAGRNPGPGVIFDSDRGCQGGFNWSSQHLDSEELRCGNPDGGGRDPRLPQPHRVRARQQDQEGSPTKSSALSKRGNPSRGRLCQAWPGGRAAGRGRRRNHCHNVRRGGRALKLLLATVPATSIRNLTGTPGPHGARTFTLLAWTARSSVLTRMPGLVTSRRLPARTATSSCSDGHQVTAWVKSSVTLPPVTCTSMRRGTIHGPSRRVLALWQSMRTSSFGFTSDAPAGDAGAPGMSETSAASSP